MTGTVLITGATGFVGSHLVEHYARLGWSVHGTYRSPITDREWLPPRVTLHHVDLRDRQTAAELVTAVRPKIVCHLAASSSVSASRDDPIGTLANNAAAQYSVLEALVPWKEGVRVLVVGSADEYGRIHDHPLAEGHELLPTTPYGMSKVVQDLMGYTYFATHGLQVVRVRPFLQLGPRRTDRFVAGSFARQVAEIAAGLRQPVLRVGNIDLERDFTDVRDVVKAFALAVEQGTPGEVYNVASGRASSLRSMLQIMLDAAGVTAEIHIDPARVRLGEVPRLIGDPGRLHTATGWKPTIPFERSAIDTLTYWQDRVRRDALLPGGTS